MAASVLINNVSVSFAKNINPWNCVNFVGLVGMLLLARDLQGGAA
jgi:hypothetical protein